MPDVDVLFEDHRVISLPLVRGGDNMKLPDITPAQIAAFVTFIVATATTLGLKLSGDFGTNLTEVLIACYAVVAAVWKAADAIIRMARANNASQLRPLK